MLMVGAKVLFNSAKMLKMGVLVVLMHNYRDQETKRDVLNNYFTPDICIVSLSTAQKRSLKAHLSQGSAMFL
mgnify:CR=1 FL=1